MIVISYIAAIAAVLIVWVCIRVFWNLKIDKTNTIYELKLLTVLASILLIMRVSYFPGPVASESIESLVINFRRLLPMDVNLIPFAGLSAGDFIGKILLFVPLGLSYKFCFNEKLDNFGKIVLWGAVLSAGIEVTQLLCYNRVTDINDLIGNVIEQQFTQVGNWNVGSGLSLVLMIFILISMAVMQHYDNGDAEGIVL